MSCKRGFWSCLAAILMMGVVPSVSSAETKDICLDGAWTLDYFPQPLSGAVRSLSIPAHETLTATVPGNCEWELVKAGLVKDPEKGLNALAFRKYEGYQWLYTRTFDARACDGADGSRAELVFDGVDTLADVFLNGAKIGECANMLVARRFDVTGKLKDGANTVQVLIRSAFLEAQSGEVGELGYHMGSADREPIRKAAYMSGWDIFPRINCAGIWRGVRLSYLPPVRIEHPVWIFGDVDVGKRTANIKVQFRAVGPMSVFMLDHKVRFALSRKGETRFSAERTLSAGLSGFGFVAEEGLHEADFWWPRGMGEPALYDARIEIVAPDGKVLATDSRRVGVRQFSLETRDITSESEGEFLLRVNGEKCFVRGSNWVPLDAFPCRQAERIPAALELWRDTNCNMVRVWGGGVYEPQAFFDWCDENGVMVWQDFMMACTAYPQTDEFARTIADEVRQVVAEFRNHASLALWCGNNEDDNATIGYSFPAHQRDPNGDRISRRTIPQVLWEMDVTRPYLPSSPFCSSAAFRRTAGRPEEHLWGNRDCHKTDYLTRNPACFVSETGFHGCPNRASLERMMSPDCVYPWTEVTNGGADPVEDFHFNDEWQHKASNPLLDRHDKWGLRRNANMTKLTKSFFGDVPRELDDFIDASQLAQAEGMKILIESFRAHKFRGKNGLVWWNMRDGWPILSDGIVDSFGGRKRAYWAIRNVQRNQLALILDDGSVVAVNDAREPVRGEVRVTDRLSGEVRFERTYEVPANAAVTVGRVTWSGRGILDLDYVQGGERQYNWFLYGDFPFDLKETRTWLDASLEKSKK